MHHLVTRGLLSLALAIFAIQPLTEALSAQAHAARPTLLNSMNLREQTMVRDEQQRHERDADRLSQQAREMEAALKWSNAARSHEAAARLRPDEDMRAAVGFANAARSYYNAGKLSDAARLVELAGMRALALGDLSFAAMSFRDAAVLLQREGNTIRSQELGWRACRLSSSPNLDDTERDAIRRNLTGCTSPRRSQDLAAVSWLVH